MKQKTLTIFTPTYNRAYILGRLYYSLRGQENKDFQWLIVDDGSSDDTEALVSGWMEEDIITIKYYKQKNGGKQRAHNKGVMECDTELFFCVDSDDFIVENCVEILLKTWGNATKSKDIAGIVALKGSDSNVPLGTYFPEGIRCSTLEELCGKYKVKGDLALIHKTSILKQHLFWVAEGEKFIGEGYVYQQIDQKYKLIILPKILAVCEYLEDGYSRNVRKLTKDNPISYTELKRQTICYSKTWHERYYHTILCIVGCIMHGKNPFHILPYKGLGILAYIPAWITWFVFYKNA